MDKRKRGRPAKAAPPASTAPVRSRRTRGETEELVDAGPSTQPETSARIPRRGAPAGRVASPSINGRGRDEEEEEDDEAFDDAQEENAPDDAAERELMLLTLPDLSYGAKQLLKVLAVDTTKLTGVQKKLLQMKRKAFLSTREIYTGPTMPQFFLDWSWFEQVHGESKVEPESSTTLVTANLAILLSTIYGIENGEDVDIKTWLEEMDVSIPFLFREEGSRDGDVDVALMIRTALAITKLADAKGKAKQAPQDIVISVFCESDAPGAAAARIVNGPFRELAGENSQATAKASSDRAEELYRLAKDKKSAVQSLQAAFPMEDLLDLLKTWAAEAFEDAEAPRPVAAVEEEEPAEEEAPETQPIQRPGVGQSLFSLKGLSNMLNLGNSSRRHTVGPSQEASQHASASASSPAARKRGFSEIGADFASDEDDGEFETDRRPVDEARREAMRLAQPSPARRPRLESEHGRSPATPAGRQYHGRDVDPVVSPEMAQMRREKQLLMQDVRAAASMGEARQPDAAALEHQMQQVKRRVAWSDSDTLLLVDLIDSHNAVWADIARIGNHQGQDRYFNPVRNQQACRDRARNYKVDLLLTNKILPRNFDLVALSRKEIDRVVRAGRNPFRREENVDAAGEPTNTVYVE